MYRLSVGDGETSRGVVSAGIVRNSKRRFDRAFISAVAGAPINRKLITREPGRRALPHRFRKCLLNMELIAPLARREGEGGAGESRYRQFPHAGGDRVSRISGVSSEKPRLRYRSSAVSGNWLMTLRYVAVNY